MSNVIFADRKTDYLLPPSVDDWMKEERLARFGEGQRRVGVGLPGVECECYGRE